MESWFDGSPLTEPDSIDSKSKVHVANLNAKISRLKQNAAEASASVERLLVSINKLEDVL